MLFRRRGNEVSPIRRIACLAGFGRSRSQNVSAGEVRSMLRVLEGWNNFDNGWIEDLKRTEISGQRHLDEKAKTIYASKRDRDEFLRELRRINEAAAEQRRKSRKPGNVS